MGGFYLSALLLLSCWTSISYSAVIDNPCSGAKQVIAPLSTSEPGSLVSHLGFGGGTSYSNSMSCSWKIIAPDDGYIYQIQVWFTEIALEAGFDFVTILAGNGTQILRTSACCNNITYVIYSGATGSPVTVRFLTDTFKVNTGFRLRYVAMPLKKFSIHSEFNKDAKATARVAARSDIECAVLCTAAYAECMACEFRADSGICVMYDRATAGLVKIL